MNDLEFTFEASVWEQAFDELTPGSMLDGVQFLAMMEPQSEAEVESALELLEEKDILLTTDGLEMSSSYADTAVRLRYEKDMVRRNALPQELEENDPLRIYLEELEKLPACENPELLVKEYQSGKEEAMSQLVNGMLPMVNQLAFTLVGRGVVLLDLIQEGAVALWKAILSYKEGDFEAHCKRYVQRSMNRALVWQARESGMDQKMRQKMEDYRAVDEQLLADLGRNPTVEELADALHMSTEEVSTVAGMVETARRLNLAKKEPEPDEEEQAETQAVEDTAYFQMRQRISELLSNLDETDAKLLTLRFGLEKGLPMSAVEVGKVLGMTAEEVSAREAAALQKLRNET